MAVSNRSVLFPVPQVNTFTGHVAAWQGCTRCELHKDRNTVCLARGEIPCDVLFVGEAPGKNEDSVGSPFVGPAGQYLDQIVEHARVKELGLTVGFTNLIACIPWETDKVAVTSPPPRFAIDACRPRLEEILRLSDMFLVVTLGDAPKKVFTSTLKSAIKLPEGVAMIHLVHPAAIIRADTARREAFTRRAVVQLQDACEDLAKRLKR